MSATNVTLSGPPSPASLGINLNNTLGAAFIGLIFAAILFGVTNFQALAYFQSSASDSQYFKWVVSFLWVLDTLHLALISHILYFFLVTNFTNLAIIPRVTWSLCLHVLVNALSDFCVRCFYTRRLWTLSKKNRFITLLSATFTLVTFVFGIQFGVRIFSYQSTTQFVKISWMLYVSLGSAVVADISVAVSLCYFLAKNKTGFKTTDKKITVLIAYVINTGLLTSVCALCCFITYAAMHDNYVFLGIYFILPKLYYNSFLATLNARQKLAFSGGAGPSAYQMQRIVNISAGTGSSPHSASFGKVSATNSSLANTHLGGEEKVCSVHTPQSST
ncbi:hypothetical protein M0805_002659 [Coniferiporia weirii]|nr:hypothetical protein M0805_002659 [Coniferiporia weirii]